MSKQPIEAPGADAGSPSSATVLASSLFASAMPTAGPSPSQSSPAFAAASSALAASERRQEPLVLHSSFFQQRSHQQPQMAQWGGPTPVAAGTMSAAGFGSPSFGAPPSAVGAADSHQHQQILLSGSAPQSFSPISSPLPNDQTMVPLVAPGPDGQLVFVRFASAAEVQQLAQQQQPALASPLQQQQPQHSAVPTTFGAQIPQPQHQQQQSAYPGLAFAQPPFGQQQQPQHQPPHFGPATAEGQPQPMAPPLPQRHPRAGSSNEGTASRGWSEIRPDAPGAPGSAGVSVSDSLVGAAVANAPDVGKKQLIVNFLDPQVNNAHLHQLFSQIGPLTAARVLYDKQTGESKGYGFVYFLSSADAARAIQGLNSRNLFGRRIKVSYANPQRPMPN